MTNHQIRAVIQGWRDRAQRFESKLASLDSTSQMRRNFELSASNLRQCASELEWLLDNSL